MELLPNELLTRIFSFLHPVYENLGGYALVCRRWDILLKHTASLWRHIHLEDDTSARPGMYKEYEQVLLSCLKRFGQFIHCIRSEEEAFFVNSQLRRTLSSLEHLRSLDVPVLVWTRIFAQSLRSASSLKSLTIDDHRGLIEGRSKEMFEKSKLHKRGIRLWDLRVLARHFPKLETLSLNICIYKLCRHEILPILDDLHLKELRLECVPYGMNELDTHSITALPPIKALLNSRHASLLTFLELRCVPVSACDLVLYLQNFKNLQHIATGISDSRDFLVASPLVLESRSITVFVLCGIESVRIENLKCVMPNLEVLLLTECDFLVSFEVHASKLLHFSVKTNCNLKRLSANCQRIEELEVQDCPSLELHNFRKFLAKVPVIRRIEISQDWRILKLDKSCCPQLRKLVVRDVSMCLSVMKINCPTLSVLKCTGDLDPEKRKLDPEFAGCEFGICAGHLKKVQINDVSNAKRIFIQCQTADLIQIGGVQPWQRPTEFVFRAQRQIDAISLKGLTLNCVQVFAPSVLHVAIEQCCIATGSKKCKFLFRCDVLETMRLIRCNRIKKFSLHVPCVTALTVDSCARLRDINLEGAKICRIRISNCPLLESKNETFT